MSLVVDPNQTVIPEQGDRTHAEYIELLKVVNAVPRARERRKLIVAVLLIVGLCAVALGVLTPADLLALVAALKAWVFAHPYQTAGYVLGPLGLKLGKDGWARHVEPALDRRAERKQLPAVTPSAPGQAAGVAGPVLVTDAVTDTDAPPAAKRPARARSRSAGAGKATAVLPAAVMPEPSDAPVVPPTGKRRRRSGTPGPAPPAA